jgi:serine/threonine protein kinase
MDGPRPRGLPPSDPHVAPELDASAWMGRVIDSKYAIKALLGQGGMSAVYEARHLGLDRVVALKLLSPSQSRERDGLRRLRHEAQVVSAIGHPNICEIYDLGCTEEGCPYLVMERLVGETLGARIARAAPMPFLELAPLVKQVLSALVAAHGKRVLHRDLKPENIFIEDWRGKPTVKLLDFGISKWMKRDLEDSQRLALSDAVLGTPYYMAPEQARGDSALDQRVDLWAIGVVLYEALTGRRPFVATNYNALLVKILTSQPRCVERLQPSIHPQVARIVAKALAKLREDRFQTAREFRGALQQAEELCSDADPQVATLVMNRGPIDGSPPSSTNQRPSVAWSDQIEDPDTCIDDQTNETEGN